MDQLIEQEYGASLKSISSYFSALPEYDGVDSTGLYKAEILGPVWLKTIAKLSLPFAGLPGWCGKRIEEDGAINLCKVRDGIQERVHMQKAIENSWLDGRSCMVLSYDSSAPVLLRPMRDEFRRIDEATLLGLSIYNLPGLRRISLPFLLKIMAD